VDRGLAEQPTAHFLFINVYNVGARQPLSHAQ
jgi:hypothetical protein